MTNILSPILNEKNKTVRTETHILVFRLPIFCSYLYFNRNPETVLFFNSIILFCFSVVREGNRGLVSI